MYISMYTYMYVYSSIHTSLTKLTKLYVSHVVCVYGNWERHERTDTIHQG